MTDPVLIHDDGSECHHKGAPVAPYGTPGGARCPAGQTITHVRLNGRLMPMDEAAAAMQQVIDALRPVADLVKTLAEALNRGVAEWAARHKPPVQGTVEPDDRRAIGQ